MVPCLQTSSNDSFGEKHPVEFAILGNTDKNAFFWRNNKLN